jgi:hypothetical protein
MATEVHPSIRKLAMPDRIKRLPIDERGWPVPWFAGWVDGKPDHRLVDGQKVRDAIKYRFCFVCGDPLGGHAAFTVGPMCVVNRTSAEPPSHRDCAFYSARACPFLSRPHAKRRPVGEEISDLNREGAGGCMIRRNPGVVAVWVTKQWRVERVGNGVIHKFDVAEPTQVWWFAESRMATPDEVAESVQAGLPALREMAEQQEFEEPRSGALARFERALLAAERYWPIRE